MRTQKKTTEIAKEIEKSAERSPEAIKLETPVFPTGSTQLNLACSDTIRAAFSTGILVNIVGDSHAGKTYLAHSIMAEAALRREFSEYDIYYDRAEASPTTGIANMFGKTLQGRIKHPPGEHSINIHDFKINVWRLFSSDKPFIYILDSLDSLDTKESEKQLDNALKGNKEKGSYGMEKPKVLSNVLGSITRKLENTKSILIILSQTRDNIDPFSFQEKTRSGGRALKFYSSYEMWLAVIKTYKKKVGKFERVIGHRTRVRVTKNKLTGKVREAEFDIYTDYGIDDVGVNIDFLIDADVFEKKEGGRLISSSDFEIEATKERLINHIEKNNLETKLSRLVGKAWHDIEESFKLNRKNKYQ